MHEYKQSPVLQVGGNQLKWFSISQETTGSIMISMLYAFVFLEGIKRLRLKFWNSMIERAASHRKMLLMMLVYCAGVKLYKCNCCKLVIGASRPLFRMFEKTTETSIASGWCMGMQLIYRTQGNYVKVIRKVCSSFWPSKTAPTSHKEKESWAVSVGVIFHIFQKLKRGMYSGTRSSTCDGWGAYSASAKEIHASPHSTSV